MALIVMAGLPGKMALEVANVAGDKVWKERHQVLPFGLGSASRADSTVALGDGRQVHLFRPEELPKLLAEGDHDPRKVVVVDYTNPTVALTNIAVYTRAGVSFVMGTTGFDRAEADRMVAASSVNAVIAPNMGIPIILIQAAMEYLAETFPGALEGYRLRIRESHQAAKKDPSGTAKALLPKFEALGMKSVEPSILSIRDEATQRSLGVPPEHILGHGWHWYDAQSPNKDVALGLSHRVNGRRIYAEGTLRAVEFVEALLGRDSGGKVYSMRDVLGERG